jgi:uncharacterized integral membrane protein
MCFAPIFYVILLFDACFYSLFKEPEMTPKRIALIIIAIVFAVFILQNAQVVEVRFLFWGTEASRAIVLLVTFFLGLFSGWLSGWKQKKAVEKKTTDKA